MRKYRIDPMPADADPALLAELEKIETASVGHLRFNGFMHHGIQSLDRNQRTRAGVAVTLALPALCSTLLHYALSHVRTGDMLVIDRLGDDKHACLGGAVARAAKQAGIVGVIIDGPCTDVAEILAEGLPVWCRGVSPVTTRQAELGGTFNRPVSCGGVPVLAGDIVLGDASGVVVFPTDESQDIATDCIAREIRVARTMGRLLEGEKLGDITRAIDKVKSAVLDDTHNNDRKV
ncbi:RraA family protein [Agrobacterium rosae]|uniref:Putative 4-hydroxy-4-methyl-2-oxoglutarate aldolase n=1 Tax=Agrobacterium rosae TaxID=1972867 RepID=A0A1R3U0H5_9HYPH|nr:RraA family protein [Agrobacterium rosae]MBN7808641.1 RraA family protein [Agrobacterium rosae]MCM2435589.1 RraA family protein [Agrobacterium rosae]MDX8304723.1 RraA family protein [Agrobacterium rosae]MDX8331655.1 RraA family protein [Agrobacterium rosae]SCX34282.1 4-hydroxy-2-oxoglutarate aldolase [Agrobacterium rosae]